MTQVTRINYDAGLSLLLTQGSITFLLPDIYLLFIDSSLERTINAEDGKQVTVTVGCKCQVYAVKDPETGEYMLGHSQGGESCSLNVIARDNMHRVVHEGIGFAELEAGLRESMLAKDSVSKPKRRVHFTPPSNKNRDNEDSTVTERQPVSFSQLALRPKVALPANSQSPGREDEKTSQHASAPLAEPGETDDQTLRDAFKKGFKRASK